MRRGIAALAGLVTAALAVALSVPVSAASWTDREWMTASASALRCGDPATVDATAWGRMLAGTYSGQSLDGAAAIDGITVSNLAPATSSSASSASATTDLGSDAWVTSLPVSSLGATLGGGTTLPFGTGNGSYSQYGRATSAGLSVGASGAVTSAGNGVVGLESPSAATPRLATLQLSALLDSSLPGLGLTTAQLADVKVRIGTVGAIASYDSCASLWNGSAPGSALTRDYLVNDLGLDLTSSRVTDLAASIRSSLTTLEATIDGLDYVTTTLPNGLLTALGSVLSLGGGTKTLTVAVDVDLAPVRALVAGPLSDGVVSIDLSTGIVSMDLEALFGAAYSSSTGLNGQPANTSVLTPAMLSAVSTRVGALLTTFLGTTIPNAITTAIDNAAVRVDVAVPVLILGTVTLTFQGTIGGFTGVAGHATPSVSASPALLSAVLANVVSTVLPSVGSTVVAPLRTTATAAATTTVSGLTGTTLPAFLTQLGTVLTALDTLLNLTVNARPDAADPVGAPASTPAGRYFETALHVGVVNGGDASTASLFFASASVGPNALRH